MNRVHLYLSEESYWILQELRVKLRCKTYDQLFNKLRELIIDDKVVKAIRETEISIRETSRELSRVESKVKFKVASSNLPSFMHDNPWLEILSRRGRELP